LQATATDNAAAVALLRQIATQTIGRPVAPIAGAATTYPVTMRDAALQAGTIETIPLYVRGAGPLQLTLYTVSGPLLTRVATYTANLTSAEAGTNVNLTPARFGVSSIPIAAGQVAQVYGPNVLAVTATVADGTGWSTTGGAGAATITNPVWSTSARVELGLNIKYTTQPVTAAAFNALQTSVAALSSLQATAADNAAAVGLLRQVAYQTIGRTVPPIDGTAVSQPGVLLRDQVPVDCELDSLPVFVKAATTFSLYRYALLAGVYTRVNTGYVATFTSAEVGTVVTLNAARFGVTSLPFKAGEFIQLSGSGAWPVTAVAADGAGWSTSAGLGATTITNPVWSTGARLELGITFKYTTQPVTAAAFTALQATASANALAVASLQAAVNSNGAAIAKLQKAMVQRIGRTATPTAGTGVANAAGVLLRDATGQDCAFGKLLIKPAGSGAFKMTRYLPNGTTLNRVATYTATIDAGEVGTDVVLTPARFGQTAINLVAGEILQIPGTGFLPLTAGVAADGTGWS
ncbi:hypothetical protein, partial [Novosphingobium sp. GV055]|uniref:hypothetical protein n=1 Tax=Novosphingobium sp. GV055 TaxID=2135690 RepID=UPI001304BB6D